MSWGFWLLFAIDVMVTIAVFAGRNWIKNWIERGVQHRFDQRLEQLRSELRNSEEGFKSGLRQKESEIVALRDGVLSGHMQRQTLIDKRRLEAIERLWTAVTSLSPYRNLAASMSVLNANAIAKRAPSEPRLRDFFGVTISTLKPPSGTPDNPAKNERPFVSELAWAYFVAFQTIVQVPFTYAKMLELGLEKPDSLLNLARIKEVLTLALPDRTEYIHQNHPLQYYFLIDDLETRLLSEIDRMLRGEEQTEQSIQLARKIVKSAVLDQSQDMEAVRAMIEK